MSYLHRKIKNIIEIETEESLNNSFDENLNPNFHEEYVINDTYIDPIIYSEDTEIIEIDEVQKILDDLKSKSCTHIEIIHHTDHNSYIFKGLEIESTEITEEEYDMMNLQHHRRHLEYLLKMKTNELHRIKSNLRAIPKNNK